MANDDQIADPEERIARLEAALQAEQARNADLEERLQAIEVHQAQRTTGSGKRSWRRVLVWTLTASVSLGLVFPYTFLVFVEHEDPVFTLLFLFVFTLIFFVVLFVAFWQMAPDYKELQERGDRSKGATQ